jgi:hypothetical protein
MGRKPIGGHKYRGDISGLSDKAMARLKGTNASGYLRRLIEEDIKKNPDIIN